jgi:hypothetical protein
MDAEDPLVVPVMVCLEQVFCEALDGDRSHYASNRSIAPSIERAMSHVPDWSKSERQKRLPIYKKQRVADHALGSGVEDIQWIGILGPVCGLLQGQQADLRAVAMGQDEAVPGLDDPCQRGRGGSGVRPLGCRRHWLPPPEERIAAKCHNRQHQSLRQPFPPVPARSGFR